MAFSLTQCLCHHIGVIAKLLCSVIDALFCIRVDIARIIQCAGYGADIDAGELCHIFKSCHDIPPIDNLSFQY